jgi:hypothetical protein
MKKYSIEVGTEGMKSITDVTSGSRGELFGEMS